MSKAKKKLLYFLCLGFAVRMVLSFLPAFEYDQSAFRFWSYRLIEAGPAEFYSREVYTNNPLGMLYFFWLIGTIKSTLLPNLPYALGLDPLLKLPAIIADLLTGILIYKLVKEPLGNKWGNIAGFLYIFNPGIIFNSAVWGQYDSVAILFLVSSVYFCFMRKSPIMCSIFFSFALVTKPQSLQITPFLLYYFLKNFKPIQWLYSFSSSVVTTIVLFLPFFPNNPFYGIYYVVSGSTNLFNCTTCNALNFWGIVGNWQNDMNLFLNIPLLYWGFLLLLGSLIIIFGVKKLKGDILYFTISISMLAFFMLLTRMHERYISYFFPFLLISAMLLKSKILIGFYIFFSIIFLINLYIPYAYYDNLAKITNLPGNDLFNNFNNFALISFIGFILLFIYYLKYAKQTKTS